MASIGPDWQESMFGVGGQQETAANVATGQYRVLFSAWKLLYSGGGEAQKWRPTWDANDTCILVLTDRPTDWTDY